MPPSMRFQFLTALLAVFISLGCQRVNVALTTTEQADVDDKTIRDYLAAKGISGYMRTNSGTYIVIDSAQPEQPYLQTGKFAYVRYRGYLPGYESIAFDSNTVDTLKAPYRVNLGQANAVITGWQDALPHFRIREKGRIFIPSRLGYGPSGSGLIGANQVLIFDIKVLKME